MFIPEIVFICLISLALATALPSDANHRGLIEHAIHDAKGNSKHNSIVLDYDEGIAMEGGRGHPNLVGTFEGNDDREHGDNIHLIRTKRSLDTSELFSLETRGATSTSTETFRTKRFQTQNVYAERERGFPFEFCMTAHDSGIICPGIPRGLFLEQFHYDYETNRCHHFIYNGCGGNANRFTSMWECTQSCVETKQ